MQSEVKKLVNLIKKARFCWICGNGGSAATAEHFATDLVKRGYPAICLNSQNAVITMFANDEGYEKIFSEQLIVYANTKDLLITISCSGTSKNIVEAQKLGFIKGFKIYEFATFESSGVEDYGKLEDLHLKFAHEVAAGL